MSLVEITKLNIYQEKVDVALPEQALIGNHFNVHLSLPSLHSSQSQLDLAPSPDLHSRPAPSISSLPWSQCPPSCSARL